MYPDRGRRDGVVLVTLQRNPPPEEFEALGQLAVSVRNVETAADALIAAHDSDPALILLDAADSLPDCIELVQRLARIAPDAALIVLGSDNQVEVGEAVRRAGARDVMSRPLDRARLLRVLRDSLADRGARTETAMAAALRHALDRGEFRLHYQPVVDLATGITVGAEALLRWKSPTFGDVPPLRLLPLAERLDLVEAIDEWVAYAASLQVATWREAGVGPRWVAVNVSPTSVTGGHLVDTIAALIRSSRAPARALMLEIPERVLLDDPRGVEEVLGGLKKLGVRLTVDDFGTAKSAIEYLKRGPFDSLKIDRLFLKGIPDDEPDAQLVSSIIRMAHGLGFGVIGEGVENRHQLEFLRSHGCDQAQGLHLGPPMPGDRLLDDGIPGESGWRDAGAGGQKV